MIWLFGAAVALGTLLSWPVLQHWLAELAAQIELRWKGLGFGLQSALIRIDRVMVLSQRLFSASVELTVRHPKTHEQWTVTETERLNIEDIPEAIISKLEQQSILEYKLTINPPTVYIPLKIISEQQ